MGRFWADQSPELRNEAIRWLSEVSLRPIVSVQFPLPELGDLGTAARASQDVALALRPDGKQLAFRHTLPQGSRREFTDQIEITDTDTGRVVGHFELGKKAFYSNSAVALAYGDDNSEVLLARSVPGAVASGPGC